MSHRLSSLTGGASRQHADYTVRSNKCRSTFGFAPDEFDEDEDGDDAFDDLVEELYEYLGTEAVVGEYLTVCLPDASIPRGPGIADEITPRRILAFLTSERVTVDHHGRIYTGGWVVDDGALYEDSCTLLAFDGPNEVFSFTPSDVASPDAQRELAQRRREGRRRPRGASLYDGAPTKTCLKRSPKRSATAREDATS